MDAEVRHTETFDDPRPSLEIAVATEPVQVSHTSEA
jgi:hypothetical protein